MGEILQHPLTLWRRLQLPLALDVNAAGSALARGTEPHMVEKPRCFVTNPPLNILQSPHGCVSHVVTVGSFIFFLFFSLTFVCPNKTLRTSHGHFHLFKDDQTGRKAGSGGDFVLVLPLSESQLTEVVDPSWPCQ